MDFLTQNPLLVLVLLFAVAAIAYAPVLMRRYKAYSMYQIGASYMRDKEFAKAAEVYRTSTQHWPNYFGAYNNLGIALLELGKYSEALEAFTTAHRLNPDHAPTMNNLGVLYYKMGRYAESAEQIEKAIALRPEGSLDVPGLQFNLGLAYLAANMPDRARVTYAEAMRHASSEQVADAERGLREMLTLNSSRPAGVEEVEALLRGTVPTPA